MASLSNVSGIEVAMHSGDAACGNPCHPAHACACCEPFWQSMQATGRFMAYVPPTFAGGEPIHKTNLGAVKLDFSHLAFRTKGSGS